MPHSRCNIVGTVCVAAPSCKCAKRRAERPCGFFHSAQAPCACTQHLWSYKFELRDSHKRLQMLCSTLVLCSPYLGCKICLCKNRSHANLKLPSPLLYVDSCTLPLLFCLLSAGHVHETAFLSYFGMAHHVSCYCHYSYLSCFWATIMACKPS